MTTDSPTLTYPGIRKAALMISLDNGGVNRCRPEKERQADLERFLYRSELSLDLTEIDAWLNGLSAEDLSEVCCGCQDDDAWKALMEQAPPFTDDLLNDFFHEAA